MRIVAGEFRGRRLLSPPEGATTRPMPDLVKQALFNLLRGHCEGASVLDCFAGTGVIGLEAVSRGAARCVLVERDRRVVKVLEQNIATLGAEARCEILAGDALGPAALARCPSPADLIFFDPPYDLVRTEAGWQRVRTQFLRLSEKLSPTGFAVLRTPWPFVHVPGGEASAPDDPPPEQRPKPRRGSKRRSDRDDWRREIDGRGPDHAKRRGPQTREPEDAEGGDAAPAAAQPVGTEPAPEPIVVDLAMPGIVGPETHVYRHTALHLYAKRAEPGRRTDGEPT
jgi:16S rRNA (guanine(966)-N(2))-methyltransferase RsmD